MQPNSDINYFLLLLVPLLAIGATTSCGLLGADGDSPVRPDTTSNNFVWSADTLGKINTVFRDVAILDSNDIWIVGNIPEEDFEGGESYNALHGNGIAWDRKRVIIESYSGTRRAAPLETIYQYKDELWFGAYNGGYTIYDGTSWKVRYLNEHPGSIFEIDGDGGDTLFVSGNNGILVGYDGTNFFRIENDLQEDILGMAFANDTLKFGTEHALRQYVDGQVIPEFSPDAPQAFRLEGRYYDIWHSGAAWWYATSRGLYRFSPDSGYVQIGNQSVSFITGNGDNDVIAVDAVGGVYHWNGQRIKKMQTPFGNSYSPQVQAIDMKDDLILVVGWLGYQGFILTGIRNE